jgi:hypothetical protein
MKTGATHQASQKKCAASAKRSKNRTPSKQISLELKTHITKEGTLLNYCSEDLLVP